MEKFNIENKVYFLNERINDWAGRDYFLDTQDYILSSTAFFKLCDLDVVGSVTSEEALEELALNNANKSHYSKIEKLLEDGEFEKLAINLEKYTDCYVLETDFSQDVYRISGPTTSRTREIDSDFDITKNYGFIAVKKKDFKNNRQEAYKFMQGLAEDYERTFDISFYTLTVYNETEEYTSIIDDDLYYELDDEQKVKHVLKENGVLQAS